jgi:hypothetical protein
MQTRLSIRSPQDQSVVRAGRQLEAVPRQEGPRFRRFWEIVLLLIRTLSQVLQPE